MRVSDNELREKLLDQLKRKGEHDTRTLCFFGNTWASDSKVKEVLRSLLEEGMVSVRTIGDTKNAKFIWSFVNEEEPKMEVAVENTEVTETLKHEFNIVLRKQQRRRALAAKILQNAEAVIKNLEEKIKCL